MSTIKNHILGLPRVGSDRELKKALESYWKGDLSESDMLAQAKQVRQQNFQWQKQAGLDFITVGDFCLYDHILQFSVQLGIIPARHRKVLPADSSALEATFLMARGRTAKGLESPASEMTKWFDTNYHYIVPEFEPDLEVSLSCDDLLEQIEEAKAFGKVKVVIPGLLSYLYLGKEKNGLTNRLALVDSFKGVYQQLLSAVANAGVDAVQIDEPCLVQTLPAEWLAAYTTLYQSLDFGNMTTLLTTYFESPNIPLTDFFNLPFDGFHVDVVNSSLVAGDLADSLPDGKVLSVGVVSGRNIWKADLNQALEQLAPLFEKIGNRLWIAPSCSLLHVPLDLDNETELDAELKNWLAFAKQKIAEVAVLKSSLNGDSSVSSALADNAQAIQSRRQSTRVHNETVKQALNAVTPDQFRRISSYDERSKLHKAALNLPLFPTTTIGSFPQTTEIRKARRAFKAGQITSVQYEEQMQAEICSAIAIQEDIGIDVLVHGEAERNDMVEYFGELMEGFVFTKNGWVQSYGTRCVKPPIIFGDISRPEPMTIKWITYAQAQTDKLVKGMLTGPVTILQWSFVRDDQPREHTCKQIALAILQEVQDLVNAGIKVVQVDEPALREGLPLKEDLHEDYLRWATQSFQLSTAGVADEVQIHTHMCYCEFNDIMDHIIALDADVISIETSRSQMELLDVFKTHHYPNEIGPGVYDIHSPRVPEVDEIVHLLTVASKHIPIERLWVNPDCGLKTRAWEETKKALVNMVQAAKKMRQ